MKQPTKTDYRNVVKKLVGIDPRRTTTIHAKQEFAYTRSPAGAWVECWVWVPKEYAQLQKGSR